MKNSRNVIAAARLLVLLVLFALFATPFIAGTGLKLLVVFSEYPTQWPSLSC